MKRFRSISRTKKFVAVGATLALTLGIAGAAFAYFTASATNTSSYVTVGSAGWSITGVSTGGGPLYPVGTTEWVTFTVTNTSGGNQLLSSVTGAVTNVCRLRVRRQQRSGDRLPSGWFTLEPPTAPTPPLPTNEPAGWSGPFSFTIALTDSSGPQNGCEGLLPQLTLDARRSHFGSVEGGLGSLTPLAQLGSQAASRSLRPATSLPGWASPNQSIPGMCPVREVRAHPHCESLLETKRKTRK